mmetsp:Transcript_19381/g.26655  ORF Transcript_19381/g.26655 Transcript_19381/m.26655 type:complete len:137 (-) Transcript_19381:201-611(-)
MDSDGHLASGSRFQPGALAGGWVQRICGGAAEQRQLEEEAGSEPATARREPHLALVQVDYPPRYPQTQPRAACPTTSISLKMPLQVMTWHLKTPQSQPQANIITVSLPGPAGLPGGTARIGRRPAAGPPPRYSDRC